VHVYYFKTGEVITLIHCHQNVWKSSLPITYDQPVLYQSARLQPQAKLCNAAATFFPILLF